MQFTQTQEQRVTSELNFFLEELVTSYTSLQQLKRKSNGLSRQTQGKQNNGKVCELKLLKKKLTYLKT